MIYQNERAIYVKIADRVCDDIQFSPQRFHSLKTDVPHVGKSMCPMSVDRRAPRRFWGCGRNKKTKKSVSKRSDPQKFSV